ncbi:ribosomal protein S18-alanine N-acetyltransferase [Thermosulfuriphilus ammonigenes]|uniref:[Ribosomal protein bS18]-alanine N-acetyltransferase n=1 Tax=Thermosulfuriphilus ammonigenes TaxID=1936021 RepID=A0A6G7PXU2_9BACT|nr:ribosomal protein S18-alanine N-acetyltransferase [Thermosulfuriphilus ammonigenes]MBA2849632.1 ribosomal-protein-alanine N-acetyltransferase [Thermosulfuriphilus ammonigenes]QIJ72268.1 ribosomal protein S18-alanine N-acetyltransferase [Thermosulfuriphilus ammonigenes]HFB83698.1 ribosomal-protein-alanine N-acetyltransferase [Thermodesulfatator sp.]
MRARIVPAREEDLPGLLEIERLSHPNPWSKAAFLGELSHKSARLWVAKVAGLPRGFISFWLVLDEIHILNLAVHPQVRRQGLATSLITLALKYGRRQGAHLAWLEVRPSNKAAIRLYQKLGFVATGRRPGYYQDTGEDAIIMKLSLRDHEA